MSNIPCLPILVGGFILRQTRIIIMHGSVIVHYTSILLITAFRHRAVNVQNQVSLRNIAHLLLDQTLSLAPSLPTHRLVFDRLQYAKTSASENLDGGKAWKRG